MAKGRTRTVRSPAIGAGDTDARIPPVDRALVLSALQKEREGAKPNRAEAAALARFARLREERERWKYYRSIPQKHWREMSGRPAKIVNEQAGRYGIPFDGATIDLPAVVHALHEFLANNAVRLCSVDNVDPLLSGENTPALEAYRRARTDLVLLELAERRESLLNRNTLHDGLVKLAGVLRGAGDKLARRYGDDAQAILNEALQEYERQVPELVGRREQGNSSRRKT